MESSRPPDQGSRPVRIANCSGFWGDRPEAASEMVEGGPIDVLTGDYLAELTMYLLWKLRSRGRAGYAAVFLQQLEDVLGSCLERGIRIVANAGGLDAKGLADAVGDLAGRLGLTPSVAHVTGDDLLPRLPELLASGEQLRNIDTRESLREAGVEPVTANAYLGGWGIAQALERGADIVICPRVTDASLAVGPAAWWFGWTPDEWDALAGAVAAGHVLECGPQATGGNFSFFDEIPGLEHPGFPLAEISADGTSVITKHPGTGGRVTVETVTAQLLYEVAGPRYLNPDVTARFDTIEVVQAAEDRVVIRGCRGEPPPRNLKVCLNYLGGYKNSVSFVLTGLDIQAKAELVKAAFLCRLGPTTDFDQLEFRLDPHLVDAAEGPATAGRLDVLVKSQSADRVGRQFSSQAAALFLATYPGFYLATPPGPEEPYAVYWPALVSRQAVHEQIVVDGVTYPVGPPPPPPRSDTKNAPLEGAFLVSKPEGQAEAGDSGEVVVPIGRLLGARSGDKGGNANLGVWARSDDVYDWMRGFLTGERLVALLPELATFEIDVYDFPNLRAVNFVVRRLLDRGVASSTRLDPQAKALGEQFRAASALVPRNLVDAGHRSALDRTASVS